MNRNIEYEELLTEIDNTPTELNYVMQRAEAKAKIKKRSRFFMIPLTSVAGFLLVFTILVNTSTAFATAVSQIPIFKDLAESLSFYPSLEDAAENDYIQKINQKQTENGITVTIDSVIADEKRIDVFYTYESAKYPELYGRIKAVNGDGTSLGGYTAGHSTRDWSTANDDIQHFTIVLEDDSVFYDNITLDVDIYETVITTDKGYKHRHMVATPEMLRAEFTFSMELVIAEPKVYEINKEVDINGQLFTVDSLEVYPTHSRLSFKGDSENSAWIQTLDFYVQDAQGGRFNSFTDYTYINDEGVPNRNSFVQRLESSFFSLGEDLTLYITGAMLLEKDMEKIPIDLANQTAERLPQNVYLKSAKREGNDWVICFSALDFVDDENSLLNIFGYSYYDESGKEYDIEQPSASSYKTYEYRIVDFPDNVVYFEPAYSHIVTLETPHEIKIN